ncbi:MAG TPA: carbohydrate ABC transporter permease [Bacilli bacterium]
MESKMINTETTHKGYFKKKNRNQMGLIILSLFMLIYGILNLFPFLFMLSSSFKALGKVFEYPIRIIPETIVFNHYVELFSPKYSFMRWYANTLVMEFSTIVLRIFIVGITAYAFARLRFRGRDIIFLIVLAALMIPGDMTLVPRYIIYKFLHITDTMWSMVLPYTFEVFLIFLVRQFFMTIPFELSEAAIIDGCNHLQVFYKIILPLARPVMSTMILFTFVWAWNDYITPYIFITNVDKQMLSVGLQYFQALYIDNYPLQMAASTLILVPVILIFLIAQKSFIEGIATSGLKG